MERQLEAIAGDLHAAVDRLRGWHAALPAEAWSRRPAPARWSPAECVGHLNLTSGALLPLLRAGLRRARTHVLPAASRYGFDVVFTDRPRRFVMVPNW